MKELFKRTIFILIAIYVVLFSVVGYASVVFPIIEWGISKGSIVLLLIVPPLIICAFLFSYAVYISLDTVNKKMFHN